MLSKFFPRAKYLSLAVTALTIIANAPLAKAQITGSATLWGTDPIFHGPYSSEPGGGAVSLTFTSANETYTVSAGFDVGTAITLGTLATDLCNNLNAAKSYVTCSAATEDSSGYYHLSLSSTLNFLVTAAYRVDTTGGRGSVTVSGGFNILPPNWTVVLPKYYVLELLYAPPGNTSSAGFTNGTTNSTTSSVGNNFTSGNTVSYQVNLGFGGDKVSYGSSSGTSTSTMSSAAFQSSLASQTGSTLKSTVNPITHTQDQFWLLLNPQIAVVQTGSGAVEYSVSTASGQSADVVNVSVAELQTPSLIPLSVLETQTDPVTGLPLPGLKNVCAKPLADNACTQANACGCVASDFAQITPLDALLANSTVNPEAYNSARFEYVTTLTLEGPACATCDPVTNTTTVTDSDLATESTGGSYTYSVGYSAGSSVSDPLGIVSVSDTFTQSFSYTNTFSFGQSNGTSHSETVTLGTSGVGCYQNYDVYQDAEFHTFAYYPVTPSVPAC
jgi:hypothetical protein